MFWKQSPSPYHRNIVTQSICHTNVEMVLSAAFRLPTYEVGE